MIRFTSSTSLSILEALCESASCSPYFSFRQDVFIILEKIYASHIYRHHSYTWEFSGCWYRGHSFHIRTYELEYLETDLHRIKWSEKLKLSRFYNFVGASPRGKAPDGVTSLNRWVYNKVASVVPKNRIIVYQRDSPYSGECHLYGYPRLPHEYCILDINSEPPRFFMKKASDYHGYYYEPSKDLESTM